jgi:hypothetical protein
MTVLRLVQWTATVAALACAIGFALLALRLGDDFPRKWRALKVGADARQVHAALGGADRAYRIAVPIFGAFEAWSYARVEDGVAVEYLVVFDAKRKANALWRVRAEMVRAWLERPSSNDDKE